MFFANSPAATWPQFGDMLSWQFLSATKRGLNEAQLEMIAQRLFGKCPAAVACLCLSVVALSKKRDEFVNRRVKSNIRKHWSDCDTI